MCGIPLEIVEQHNYLGVCLHHRMSWQPCADFICNKANRLLGFLRRNLQHCPSKLKECTYKQLILPTLDYWSSIWDSHQHKLIHKLEMIHWTAWFVMNKPWMKHYHNSISEMLHKLNWPSLQTKRKNRQD